VKASGGGTHGSAVALGRTRGAMVNDQAIIPIVEVKRT
jgi:hypothetical protein